MPVPLRRALSIVAASHHLDAYPGGVSWARQVWASRLDAWTHDGAELLVLSPDGHPWALELAERAGRRWVEVGRDGRRRSSWGRADRWTPDIVHPHQLAERLILAAREARAKGWEVELITLRVEEHRHDDGLGRLLRLARRAGLEADEYTRYGLELVG